MHKMRAIRVRLVSLAAAKHMFHLLTIERLNNIWSCVNRQFESPLNLTLLAQRCVWNAFIFFIFSVVSLPFSSSSSPVIYSHMHTCTLWRDTEFRMYNERALRERTHTHTGQQTKQFTKRNCLVQRTNERNEMNWEKTSKLTWIGIAFGSMANGRVSQRIWQLILAMNFRADAE